MGEETWNAAPMRLPAPTVGRVTQLTGDPISTVPAWNPGVVLGVRLSDYVLCAPNTFGWALEWMKAGKRARRRGWESPGYLEIADGVMRWGGPYDALRDPEIYDFEINPFIELDDLTATDWELAE